MLAEVFREYDIRGVVGEELQIERVYDLGRAIATYLVQLGVIIYKMLLLY